MKSSENAPSSSRRAERRWSSKERLLGRARRWTITSLSAVDWKIEPAWTSRARSAAEFVRLPLWATPISPREQRTTMGCALQRREPPVVE